MVSRVAWDYGVGPVLAAQRGRLCRDDVVWAFGVAATRAVPPRRARVGTAVADAPVVDKLPIDSSEGHSKHWDVRFAGLAGSASCIRWILRHKARRNNTRECLSACGACAEAATSRWQLVDSGARDYGCRGDGDRDRDGNVGWWVRESGLAWPAGEGNLRDEIRAVYISMDGIDDSLMSEVCRGGHLETAKWVVSRGRAGSWRLLLQHVTNNIWEPEALKWMMETHAVKPKNERTGS
ncbi:hypothetical protein Pelo_16783 [Pelomyxa schiedti]|nr:hypothetical protein Pelo_16783 [Pelomyxa schiedti]